MPRRQAQTKVSGENKCYLKDLQDIARSHEAVDAQMESMNKSPVSSRD